MKLRLINIPSVMEDRIEEILKPKETVTQLFKRLSGLATDYKMAVKEHKGKIYQKGKWSAGWILPDNSIIVSKWFHHIELRYSILGVEPNVNVFKLGWIQLWNRGVNADRPSDTGILSANCNFKDIDRLTQLVINSPMYKYFYKIEISVVVRGREIEREVWLKEDKAEKEVGFSLLNPYR